MKKLMLVTFMGLLLFSCNKNAKEENANPFLNTYSTPYGVPPFNKIKPEHYLPALEEGIKQQNANIDSIIANTATPTFANTIAALDYSGELFNRVSLTFSNIQQADATPEIDAISEKMSAEETKHIDNILLNNKLFARIKTVYDNQNTENLTTEQKMLLEKTYKKFVRGGANLNEMQKNRLREINTRLSTLGIEFEKNVRAETNAFQLVVDKIEDCEGVPQSVIDAAASTAKEKSMNGKWIFTLDRPSIMPFLQTAKNRALREKIYKGYTMRCDQNNANDNKKNIAEQVSLRAEKAHIFGFKNYAEYALDQQMAKTPEAAINLLMQIWEPALALAKREETDMQRMITQNGEKIKFEAWDWNFYAEKVRKEKYDLNEDMLLPYFSIDNVLQGVFDVVFKLYGLQFVRNNNIPVYHPDVVAYEVRESDNTLIGILMMDFYARPTKGVGAWMTNYREQCCTPATDVKPIFPPYPDTIQNGESHNVMPIVSLVYNFPKPANGKPSLLNIDDVHTMFHEFGHSLHGLLSKCTYPSVAGTNTATDFVEMPSQIMENWAMLPEVLRMYARHYETGDAIPDELIAKIDESGKFNQGFNNVEYLAAALLDMAYHTCTDTLPIADIDAFEKNEMDKIGLISQIAPRYRSTYFKHPFVWGYTAGYYSYRWSAVLDADAFEAFKENGYFDQKTALSFRQNILEKGGTDEPMKLYEAFRGHKPQVDALLEREGLKSK